MRAQVFAELESEACAAEGLPSPPADIFAMDGEEAAAQLQDDPMQLTWHPAHLGAAALPVMDFSHDWAPIVTPAQRRSLDEAAAAARARSGAAAGASGRDAAAEVAGLEGALRQGLWISNNDDDHDGGGEEAPRSPMSSGSYGDMPVALAEQVRVLRADVFSCQ